MDDYDSNGQMGGGWVVATIVRLHIFLGVRLPCDTKNIGHVDILSIGTHSGGGDSSGVIIDYDGSYHGGDAGGIGTWRKDDKVQEQA